MTNVRLQSYSKGHIDVLVEKGLRAMARFLTGFMGI